jgi:hypothetical protein
LLGADALLRSAPVATLRNTELTPRKQALRAAAVEPLLRRGDPGGGRDVGHRAIHIGFSTPQSAVDAMIEGYGITLAHDPMTAIPIARSPEKTRYRRVDENPE